jgi:hypothetical protein
LSEKKDFLRESSWRVEVMHFLLFSPVLLVSTLRFMTAYVIPGQLEAADVQAAQNALTTLERAIAADYQDMSSLQAQAKSMGDRVHLIEQQHGC